jgi:hypothetical protein
MQLPGMTIETDPDGVARIRLHIPAGAPADDGFRLLRAAMPALRSLDRQIRRSHQGRK